MDRSKINLIQVFLEQLEFLKENKYDNIRNLCKSVREAKRKLYTPSTDKFDGYSQYPRPVTNYLDNLKKSENSNRPTFSKIKIQRNNNFFKINIPTYLTNRQISAERTQRTQYFDRTKSRKNLDTNKTILSYLMKRSAKSTSRIIKPSEIVYKSIRKIKPNISKLDVNTPTQPQIGQNKAKEVPKAKGKELAKK